MSSKLTEMQYNVLENLAAGVYPIDAEEFDAYVALRGMGLADYNPATRTVTPTEAGTAVLQERDAARKQGGEGKP